MWVRVCETHTLPGEHPLAGQPLLCASATNDPGPPRVLLLVVQRIGCPSDVTLSFRNNLGKLGRSRGVSEVVFFGDRFLLQVGPGEF